MQTQMFDTDFPVEHDNERNQIHPALVQRSNKGCGGELRIYFLQLPEPPGSITVLRNIELDKLSSINFRSTELLSYFSLLATL